MKIKDLFNINKNQFYNDYIITYNYDNYFKIKNYIDNLLIKNFITDYFFIVNDERMYHKLTISTKSDDFNISFIVKLGNYELQLKCNLQDDLINLLQLFDVMVTENYKKPFTDSLGFFIDYSFVIFENNIVSYIIEEWLVISDNIYIIANNEIKKINKINKVIIKLNETEYSIYKLRN